MKVDQRVLIVSSDDIRAELPNQITLVAPVSKNGVIIIFNKVSIHTKWVDFNE